MEIKTIPNSYIIEQNLQAMDDVFPSLKVPSNNNYILIWIAYSSIYPLSNNKTTRYKVELGGFGKKGNL